MISSAKISKEKQLYFKQQHRCFCLIASNDSMAVIEISRKKIKEKCGPNNNEKYSIPDSITITKITSMTR